MREKKERTKEGKKGKQKNNKKKNMMRMMMLNMKKINEVGKKVTANCLSTLHPPHPTKFVLEVLLKVPKFRVFVK